MRFFSAFTLLRATHRTYIYIYIYLGTTHKFIAGLISANKPRAVLERTRVVPRPVSRYNRHFSSDRVDSSCSTSEVPRRTRYLLDTSRNGSSSETTNSFFVPTIQTARHSPISASVHQLLARADVISQRITALVHILYEVKFKRY